MCQLRGQNERFLLSQIWEKNPALAARRSSMYNSQACNIIDEQAIQSLSARTTLCGLQNIATRFW